MKVLILLFAIMAPGLSVAADCKGIESLARSIMETRQNGIPLGSAIEVVNAVDVEEVARLAKGMVLDAYEMPRYNTKENKIDSILRFQNKWALYCYKNMGDK